MSMSIGWAIVIYAATQFLMHATGIIAKSLLQAAELRSQERQAEATQTLTVGDMTVKTHLTHEPPQ